MKQLIELNLISPLSSESFHVEWIQLEGPHGEFVIGYEHSPIISIIAPQTTFMYRKESGNDINLTVNGGILSFLKNKATVILD